MDYAKAFFVGGCICVLAQILIDKTKITSGRILVSFVVLGCLLSGLGLYEPLVTFAGAGATVPLPGFGHLLAQGVQKEIDQNGISGILTGGLKAASGGVTAAVLSGLLMALLFNPKPKL